MKHIKLALPLLLAAAYAPQAWANPFVGSDLQNLTVFGATYVTTGANSTVFGNVSTGDVGTNGANGTITGNMSSVNAWNTGAISIVGGNANSGGVTTSGAGAVIGGNLTSSGAATIGAGAIVKGNMVAGGVTTTGDSAKVLGYVQSGGAASIGANSVILGNVAAMGAVTVGTLGSVGSQSVLGGSPVGPAWQAGLQSAAAADAKLVTSTQSYLNGLGSGNLLAATMTTSTTLNPGVYSAASLSLTAGITLTFDAHGLDNQSWVFNLTNILVTGASVNMVLINAGLNDSVYWNSGGYAAVGAGNAFKGIVLAKDYVSVGANAYVTNVNSNNSCGGVFSATSYVSTGDSAVIGGSGCMSSVQVAPVPEPESYALTLAGLMSIGFISRRRKLS